MRVGAVLAGKYRVERVLGTGGMGVVVEAHHLQLEEKVALKFLLPRHAQRPEAVARFDREARVGVRIKSEHVARVTDVGHLQTGAPYLVMEYLEGEDLASRLERLGPMPVEQAVEFVLQACEAIAEAHALGIVHRDLKPANLFCVSRADGMPSIKVLDFGVCKASRSARRDTGLTRNGAIVGSPAYMAPEQMESSDTVDGRADLWALGVTLYELVSGHLPFTGGSLLEVATKIESTSPPSLEMLCPDLPPGFAYVVERCLEKDRERRFQCAAELSIALRDYGPAHAKASVERVVRTMHVAGISQARLPPSGLFKLAHVDTVRPPPMPPVAVDPESLTEKTKRRSALPLVGVAVLVVAVAGAGLLGKGRVAHGPDVAPRPAARVVTSAAADVPAGPSATPSEPVAVQAPVVVVPVTPQAPARAPSIAVVKAGPQAGSSPSAAVTTATPALVAASAVPAPSVLVVPRTVDPLADRQ